MKSANFLGIRTDENGFLCDPNDWSEAYAQQIASLENIKLSADHWLVIEQLRAFYQEYQLFPALRVLIKQLSAHWGKDKANSLYLHQLFPGGPIKQASKIAGLPKPMKCL